MPPRQGRLRGGIPRRAGRVRRPQGQEELRHRRHLRILLRAERQHQQRAFKHASDAAANCNYPGPEFYENTREHQRPSVPASRSPGPTGPSATRRHQKAAFANGSAATRARAGSDSARSAIRFPRLRPSTSAPPPAAPAPAKKDPRRRRSADGLPRPSPSRRTAQRSRVTRTWTGR